MLVGYCSSILNACKHFNSKLFSNVTYIYMFWQSIDVVCADGWMDEYLTCHVLMYLKNSRHVGREGGREVAMDRRMSITPWINLIWMDANTSSSLSNDIAFIVVWLFMDKFVCRWMDK